MIYQLHYSKMLLVDLFEVSVFNDQITSSVKQRQTMQNRIRRLTDEQSDHGIHVYNTVCTLLKHYTIVKTFI